MLNKYVYPKTRQEKEEVCDIILDICSYVAYSNSRRRVESKQRAYKAVIKFRQKYLLGSYPDMNLWRIFPANRNLTIRDYKQQFEKNNVMVTSRNKFQSWTKDIEKAMKYWELDLDDAYVSDPRVIPMSIIAESLIKGNDILLDMEDFQHYAIEFMPENLKNSDYYEAMEHMDYESEVLVVLKGKQAEVKSLKFLKYMLT